MYMKEKEGKGVLANKLKFGKNEGRIGVSCKTT